MLRSLWACGPERVSACCRSLAVGLESKLGASSPSCELPLLGFPKCMTFRITGQSHGLPCGSPSIDISARWFARHASPASPLVDPCWVVRTTGSVGSRSPGRVGRLSEGCHALAAHRSCCFSQLQRLDPSGALRACCIPQPILGFVWFSARLSCSPLLAGDQSGCSLASVEEPVLHTHSPFRAFPLQVAVHSDVGEPMPSCWRRSSQLGLRA